MAYVNGAARERPGSVPPAMTAPVSELAETATMNKERFHEIKQRLIEPFDPEEIKWRVTATSTIQTKHGPQKRGQLIAYADQRAYTDRLNSVFGEWGWTRDYDVQVAQNFERRTASDKSQSAVAAKVVVVSRVTIHGLGTHTGVGEEWADDENAATRAEAQAFKRACACFGLGRYLYDLDKTWVDLDQSNRPAYTPSLPEWALPASRRPQQRAPAPKPASSGTAAQRSGLVRDEALAAITTLGDKVGFSLAQSTLQKYGGTADLKRLGYAKLTLVMDKLTDLSRGIERLLAGRVALGDAAYSVLCREMSLASDSIDDIPDRGTLRVLVERVEEQARSKAPTAATSPAPGRIAEARGRLLQAARKHADRTRKRLADVIEQASVGTLTLEGLKDLTDANVPEVEAATARLS
ncbi:MAG: hypothetical protein MNPFHGCM_03036 [Gemmatimonadaceae bacterium]|nr:hypothetical protein [Gemmatimonadaceae bacterium]